MQKLGKYEVIGELGRGGMGTVYKGRDPFIDREVAIKVISGHVLNDPAIRKRFFREAKSAGRLSHPNITVVYDVGEDDGTPYIVMELLHGQSLGSLMRSGTMTLKEEVDVMLQVAQALQYAHQHQVIHRDIKPDNIQVLPSGRVKVLDFGIARIESEATMTNASIGTPKYMSPEQIDGTEIDQRTDIFSFGVLFYEMLAGHNPFQSERLTTTIYKVLNEQPERVRLEGAYLRDDVQDVVFRCLSKNKEQRYSDFGAVIDDLLVVQENMGADGGIVTGGTAAPFDEDATRVVGSINTQTVRHVPEAASARSAAQSATAESTSRPKWQAALLLVGVLGLAALGGYLAFGGGGQVGPVSTEQTAGIDAGSEGQSASGQDTEGTVAIDNDLMELMTAADRSRDAMLVQKSRADGANAQSGGAYTLAKRQEADGEHAYQQGDEAGYLRAVSYFESAEQDYAAATLAAGVSPGDAGNIAAQPQQTPQRQPAATTPPSRESASTTPPVRQPAATTPPATETATPDPVAEEPAETASSTPPQSEAPSASIGVSGGARISSARGAAASARSTASTMRATVNAGAEEDARYKLARAAERKGETAFASGNMQTAISVFNLAANIYPQVKLGRDMPALLEQSQRQITAVYQRYLQRRDLIALQHLFPRSSSRDQQVWKQFIDEGGEIAIYMLNSNAKADNKKASVDIAIHLDYTDPQGGKHQSKMDQKWAFASGGSGWYVSKMD